MPEISRFYGIVIQMFFSDHNPPHFHAYYQSDEVVISIANLSVIRGKLAPRAMGMVMEWASLHQNELVNLWNRAKNLKPLNKIDPLP